MVNMKRLFINNLYIISTFLIANALPAQGEDNYYKELRKLNKWDPATIKKLKRSTHNKKLAEEMNKRTAEYNARMNETKKNMRADPTAIADDDTVRTKNSPTSVASKKEPTTIKKTVSTKPSQTPSGPINVNHETPDELVFPGPDEK